MTTITQPKRGRPFLPDGESMVLESFRYPRAVKYRMERYCEEMDVSMTDAIRKAIEYFLDDQLEFSQKSQSVSGSSPSK